jgi:hypothetical protein
MFRPGLIGPGPDDGAQLAGSGEVSVLTGNVSGTVQA